jgi:hypothetical protein
VTATAVPITVDIDNYATAEVAFQIDRFVALGAVVNRWLHFRAPTPLDQQSVIRMNRDTLYSTAVVDISGGATLTLPDGGGRYLTVMVVNEDGYLNRVFHEAGEHPLTVEEFDTGFVLLVARTLVDPTDADDIARANRLQDGLAVDAASARAWEPGRFDEVSYGAVKKPLLALGAAGVRDSARTFGRKDEVDRVRFLIGSAGGFGGLPEAEAYYAIRAAPLPSGRYRLTVGEVPVDAFWSISVYNRDGYFDPNEYDSYSVNSVTAGRDADGAVTVDFGPAPDGTPNFLYVTDGWNYVVRLYRPRPAVLDGTWTFPEPEPLD